MRWHKYEDALWWVWLAIIVIVGGSGLAGGAPDWLHGWWEALAS